MSDQLEAWSATPFGYECTTCKGEGVVVKACCQGAFNTSGLMRSHAHVCQACKGDGRRKEKPS